MGRPTYGTRFDARIEAGIRAGQTVIAISKDLGVSRYFIGIRANELGLAALVYENGCAAKRRAQIGRKPRSPRLTPKGWGRFVADVNKAPGDALVSDVARSLRDRPAELSDVAVAALHQRGLTIDELCDGTCRPPWMIIRAVREATRCS